ncbi:MAG: hypothetical protein FWH53_01695 [Leptospirales bacterium]|nr:hypothetical protein [Leptospirales bacterium]
MKLRIFTILILLSMITVIPLRAELVFLNDGSIIEGEIVENVKESITVKDNYNKLHEIQRGDILRIRQSIETGKVYIQKRNGEGISAYIVDENRISYTLRTELDNLDEFIIKKSDVLFISNFALSDLQGFLDTNQIYLLWTKPHISVKHYKVYYTTGKNEKYKLDGITTDNSYRLKNISSGKIYYIIVTSVGMDNYESPPSNELSISTDSMNSPPAEEVASRDKRIFPFNNSILIKPLYLYPLGDLKNDNIDYGFGASIGLLYYKIYSTNLLLSLDAGYLRWIKDNKALNSHVYMIPATFSIGYRFNFTESFAVSVLIGGGGVIISDNCYMLLMNEEKVHPFEALFTGAMNFDFIISENFSFFIGGGVYSIYKRDKTDQKGKIEKKDRFKNFAEGHIGISCRIL